MDKLGENMDMRKGKRVSVGVGINSFLHAIDESDEASKKAFRTAKVQNCFKDCIVHIYKDSAFLVLQSVNAVYILNEKDKGMLKRAQPNARQIKRLIIYTNDSLVYSDLDARQEQIKFWFNNHGERIDKYELISSKFQMRRRFPYQNDVDLMKKNIVNKKEDARELIDEDNARLLQEKIKEIDDEKLRKSLKNLISSNSK